MTGPLDVLVVGGGPAGAATAALLARRGYRAVIVDRAVFPRPKPCGDYLNPGCDEVFERLGVRDALERAAAPVRGMRLVTADGDAAALPFPRRNGWALQRSRLDQALLDHALRAGVLVRDGSRLAALEPDARTVRVTMERGGRTECCAARLVVGADGLRSAVARAAGIPAPMRHGRYTVGAYLAGVDGLPADLSADPPAAGGGWGEIHLRRDGYCGVAHLPGGLANVTLAVPRHVVRAWRGDLEAGYWTWLRECPGLRDRLGRAERIGPLTAVGPLGYYRRRAGRGRVLLVGDAAAHLDPMTGQGVYLALRGAELCAAIAADALERSGAPSLRKYALARAREFGPVFAGARLVQTLAFRPAVVRRTAAQLVRHPDLGQRLIGMIGNTAGLGGVLHPAVLPRLLGWV
jgi:flavin-dependent dehydrogenase